MNKGNGSNFWDKALFAVQMAGGVAAVGAFLVAIVALVLTL